MKVLGWIIGVPVLLFVGIMVIGANSNSYFNSPQFAAERTKFCAQSPDQREMAYVAAWDKLRRQPGTVWGSYSEFKRSMSGHYGC